MYRKHSYNSRWVPTRELRSYFYAWSKAYLDTSINNFDIHLNKYSEPSSVKLIKQVLEPHQLFTTVGKVKPYLLSNEHCPSVKTKMTSIKKKKKHDT